MPFGTVVQTIDSPVFCAFIGMSIMWHELREVSNDSSKMGLKQFILHCPRPVGESIRFSDKNYALRVQEKRGWLFVNRKRRGQKMGQTETPPQRALYANVAVSLSTGLALLILSGT